MKDPRATRNFNDLGKRFVYRVGVMMRTAAIHNASNKAMNYSLRLTSDAANRLQELVEEVEMISQEQQVHVNGARLRLDRSMMPPVSELSSLLRARGVGGLKLKGPTTQEHWRTIARAVLEADEVPEHRATENLRKLNDRLGPGIPAAFLPIMTLQRGTVGAQNVGEGYSIQLSAAKAVYLYVRAVRAVEMLETTGAPSGIPLGIARIVQQLVELAFEEPRHYLALINLKDDFAYELRHKVNTVVLSIALGRRLGLNRAALLDLGVAVLACDLGMKAVPQSIRDKPGALDELERRQLERHPLESVRIALRAFNMDHALRRRMVVAFEHHMGFDGTGYPRPLLEWQQHLFSRIVAIADTYDALTTTTSWRMGLLPDEALARLVEDAGVRLDPHLVNRFCNMMGRYPLGTLLLLDSGELGVVYMTPSGSEVAGRPILRLLMDAQGQALQSTQLVDLQEKSDDGGWRRNVTRTVKASEAGIDVQRAIFG